MSLVIRRGLCPAVSSLVQAKRFRGKINLRKPRTPHFEKQLFTEFTRPKFVKKYQDTNIIEVCSFLEPPRHEVPENPYQKILAKELRERFENTRLIVFYHINPVSGEDKLRTEINFKKENMLLMVHARSTLKMALEGTPYEAVLPFYISHNAILFCPEPDIKKLLKMSKRIPHLILLAAILEGKFISKDELIYYSTIPNLQAAQSGLVQTLNSVGGQIVNQLNSHQNNLVSQLQERIKQLEEVK